MSVSGVNPTDWKARRGDAAGEPVDPAHVPNQDGAGTVDAVGEGVDPSRVGERVWLWEAAWQRANGTAQEYVALPERQAVPLTEGVSLDVGASLGIPALTAHICLTASESGPRRSRRTLSLLRRCWLPAGRGGRSRCDPARGLGGGAGDRDGERRREG